MGHVEGLHIGETIGQKINLTNNSQNNNGNNSTLDELDVESETMYFPETEEYSENIENPEESSIDNVTVESTDEMFEKLEELGYSFDEDSEEYIYDEALATILGFPSSTFSMEDIESLIGNLSETEYNEMILDIENYYQEQADYYQSIEDDANGVISDLIDLKISASNKWNETIQSYRANLDRLIEEAYINHEIEDEDYFDYMSNYVNATDAERYEWIKEKFPNNEEWISSFESQKLIVDQFNEELLKEYHDRGYGEEGDPEFSTYEEFMERMEELNNVSLYAQQYKNEALNRKDCAYFNYLYFRSDYETFSELNTSPPTNEEIEAFYQAVGSSAGRGYEYQEYVKLMGEDCSEARFVFIAKSLLGDNCSNVLLGINHYEEILSLYDIAEYDPTLLKEYLYACKEGKEDTFFDANANTINNWIGQYKAAEVLENLDSYEDVNELLKELMAPEDELSDEIKNSPEYIALKSLLLSSSAISNETEVAGQGVLDGLGTFTEGCGYSLEALLTIFGISSENRTRSSEEYKKMYILYALCSNEDKEKSGLLTKDADGNYVNVKNGPIDFTQEYVGPLLSNNYEISQGIGNMLPSIALSYFNPMIGSVALGISAGGNAYHGAMVEGHSMLSSFMYGVVTGFSESISERILGGLPFLSDAEVTNLKSYINAVRKETNQEMFQGVFDYLYQWGFMGEKIPSTEDEWKEFSKDILKQGIYGGITAGIMDLPSWAISAISRNDNSNITDINELDSSNDLNMSEQEQIQATIEWKNSVYKSKFSKVVNGIRIVSDSKEGLIELENYLNEVFANTDSDQLEVIKKQGLIVTNIKKKGKNVSFNNGDIICIHENDIHNNNFTVFTHEATHFMDGFMSKDIIKKPIENLMKYLKINYPNIITEENIRKFVDDYNNNLFYLYNNSSIIDEEVNKIIKEKYSKYDSLSTEEKNAVFNREKQILITKKIRSLYAISDIFDALTNGKLHDLFGIAGHGEEYYNMSASRFYKEIIANVGLMVNNGQEDLLLRYFPSDVAHALIDDYKALQKIAILSKKIDSSRKQQNYYVSCILEYISDADWHDFNENLLPQEIRYIVGDMNSDTIAMYILSQSVSTEYLNYCSEIIDKKYGEGKFLKCLDEYYKTGNVDCFPPDCHVREFFKLQKKYNKYN